MDFLYEMCNCRHFWALEELRCGRVVTFGRELGSGRSEVCNCRQLWALEKQKCVRVVILGRQLGPGRKCATVVYFGLSTSESV